MGTMCTRHDLDLSGLPDAFGAAHARRKQREVRRAEQREHLPPSARIVLISQVLCSIYSTGMPQLCRHASIEWTYYMIVVYVTILVACVTQNTITSSQVGNTERDPTFVRSTLADGKFGNDDQPVTSGTANKPKATLHPFSSACESDLQNLTRCAGFPVQFSHDAQRRRKSQIWGIYTRLGNIWFGDGSRH